jgi:hypothetical protein
MRWILAIVGAVIGVLIVRSFFLDPIEEAGWRLFWEAFGGGHIGLSDLDQVSESTTFMKSALGAGVGAILEFVLGSKR